jgi:predicted GNAT family acetyltransferase
MNVRGPAVVADAFAQVWTAVTGQRPRVGMRQGVYELRQVAGDVAVGEGNGRLRLATANDYYVVRDWAQQFQQEALHEDDREAAHLMIAQFVQNEELYLWDVDEPVAMAAKLRPTRHGIAISLVYTPPDKRGLGHASRCVASLSQQLLAEGRQFCTLFTDLNNPTSNQLYQRIGYCHIANFHEYIMD